MPRRPRGKNNAKKPRPLNREDDKINRWNKFSDIPLDEEDQFHVNRDQILLDGERLDDDGDEDEVFALKGMPETSSSDEDEEEQQQSDAPNEASSNTKKKKTAIRKKPTGASTSTAVEDEDDKADESDEEEEETWGSKKSTYYSTNAAHFDSEDEEANKLEEDEAKRLQSKARDVLTDEDFGLADNIEGVLQEQNPDITEPGVPQPLPQDKPSLLRYLEKTSPETLALARDWGDIAHSVVKVDEKLKRMESEKPDALSLGMIHLHYQTLLTYATTLAFYLYLRSKPKYATQPESLKKHPILNRLLTLKHSLATLEELDFDVSDESREDGSDDFDLYDDEDDDLDLDDDITDSILHFKKKKSLELNELQELLKDAEGEIGNLGFSGVDSDSSKSIKGVSELSKKSDPPKKKRKISNEQNGTSKPIFDLVEPEFSPSSSNYKPTATSTSIVTELDVFGEPTSLQATDAADKKARRRSLRFHTAKIEGAAGRRERGVKKALGGDEDIPYKERKKQKEIRNSQELAKKGRGEGGDDLSDTEPVAVNGTHGIAHGKRKRSKEDDESGGEEEVDGYYSLVQKKSKEKKEQKKFEYEAARAADRNKLMSVETSDGPRGLTTAIIKNRGLTPHRAKSVRNPRVKKRMRFEKAKKKLSSQKAVYKGGIGESGRYVGEKTGISKVVKAVKL